jgi:hypothetical protein
MISIFFIVVLLAEVAYKLSPLVVLSHLGLIGIIWVLKYLIGGLLWMGLGLANLLGWLVVGLSKAGTWPLLAFKYVAEKA